MGDGLLPIPDSWPMVAELRHFYSRLPLLLAEGHAVKYVVVRDGQMYDIWDTFHDARQFGYEKFGDGRFLSQKIDQRMVDALAAYFGPVQPVEPAALAADLEVA